VIADNLRAAAGRLRVAIWPITQAALAAGLAWWITHEALGHKSPFFAPIAAAISLSAAVGRRWRNAARMMFGVTLGIALAEVVVAVIGTGVLPLTLIVLLVMSAAVLFTATPMFVNQAAASAILVVTLHTTGLAGERLVDALIGGGCALLISLLLFPPHPLPLLGRAIRGVLDSVAAALRGAAEALENGEPHDPEWTLSITHQVGDRLGALGDARLTAADIVTLAPLRRGYRGDVERGDRRAAHAALLANTVVTLVRLVAAVLDDQEPAPASLSEAVSELSAATHTLAHGASPEQRRRVRAVLRSMAEERPPVYGPPAVAAAELQLRAAAADLLRVMREEDEDVAWQRAMRMRSAVRASRPATAARTARRAAARSGGGSPRRR
jgi:uncharacterized membrane protein YgaE (UPF0421/DUF939 family)